MTVLNTVEIMNPHPAGIAMLAISLIFFVACFLLALFAIDCDTAIVVVAVLGIVFAAAGMFTALLAPDVPTGKFQIEATFTDDFPFISVMNEYEVIEQRGDIFVLEPKERTVE